LARLWAMVSMVVCWAAMPDADVQRARIITDPPVIF
jgi:hypothetical protein